jgi:hypothetical protein
MATTLKIRDPRRSTVLLGALALASALLGWSTATAQSSASYQFPRQSIDAGAGRSSSASYTMNATFGQPDVGAPLTSASYSLQGGFHRTAPAVSQPDEIFSNGFEAS